MKSKIEEKVNTLEKTSIAKASRSSKIAYSNYFEVQLSREDFGKNRKIHNQICNGLLLPHLEALNKEGIQFCDEVSNATLIENISKNPEESPDKSLTWHHCHSSTLGKDRQEPGVMHLVPQGQHRSSSGYSTIFHPDDEGGYHEWPFLMVHRLINQGVILWIFIQGESLR